MKRMREDESHVHRTVAMAISAAVATRPKEQISFAFGAGLLGGLGDLSRPLARRCLAAVFFPPEFPQALGHLGCYL